MDVTQICEIAMLLAFGFSWPFNIIKSARSRTAKGKSTMFEIIVEIGYVFGVIGKFYTYSQTGVLAYSVWFYFLDITMVLIDLILVTRNRKLDRERDEEAALNAQSK